MSAQVERICDESWQDEIKRLEEECRIAFLGQDLERLRQLWSENLAVNSPINRVHDRSQVLDLLEKGIIRHVSLDQHIERMERYADVAVVMGHDVVKNAPEGPAITRRFTNVWSATNGSWQLIARQATHVAES
ncbi:MAG TPA: nuclear transport factor 2 family protein [Thermoanaerobaculia bacterium]|nr:nuclear transport factor 2 family protein [Thermoanaerobaculia bacterium]